MAKRGRLLLVIAQCDGGDVGESWCGYKWAFELAHHYDVTMLTNLFPGDVPPSKQVPHARVVEWPAFPFLSRIPRLNRAIKPWYPNFYSKARRWMKNMERNGETFDLVHHMTPMAMRYPSPCAGLGLKYIIGPVAGTLATPAGFLKELDTQPVFMKLRDFDGFRLRHDPMLRKTYEDAAAVICSAPYVKDRLSSFTLKKTIIEPEVSVDEVCSLDMPRSDAVNELKMVFVGRIVRTKGVRDAVRAMSQLKDLPGVTLDVIGEGEDSDACKIETAQLGVQSQVRFLGRKSPAEVMNYYKQADVFCFPSFREPTGIVLFEAMGAGLPVIAADAGGPAHIITDKCGINVYPSSPEKFASGIADAIRKLATQPELRKTMAKEAIKRAAELGLWKNKLVRISALYEEVAGIVPQPKSD